MRSPNWTRDELILALNLYFELGNRRVDKSNPRVIKLSKILNSLPIHDSSDQQNTFRNANGVAMKLGNFQRLDPSYPGKGLERGSRLEEQIWEEFNGDQNRLKKVASTIIKVADQSTKDFRNEYNKIEVEFEVSEGEVLSKLHRYYERNHSIVKKKKESVLIDTGQLACEVCSFDFSKVYGELGYGFIECHHVTPLSDLTPLDRSTTLKDLALVCSNCHRMLHRKGNISIGGLRNFLNQK